MRPPIDRRAAAGIAKRALGQCGRHRRAARRRHGLRTQIGDDRFTWFGARARESRLNVLDLPCAGHPGHVVNGAARDDMRACSLAGPMISRLAAAPQTRFADLLRAAQEHMRALIWWCFADLKAYRLDPSARRTGFAVLDRPDIPLHTSGSAPPGGRTCPNAPILSAAAACLTSPARGFAPATKRPRQTSGLTGQGYREASRLGDVGIERPPSRHWDGNRGKRSAQRRHALALTHGPTSIAHLRRAATHRRRRRPCRINMLSASFFCARSMRLAARVADLDELGEALRSGRCPPQRPPRAVR